MTEGHKHIHVRVPAPSARFHLLQTPLRRTCDEQKVRASKWVYRADKEILAGDGPLRYATTFTLTPLGILHALFGITIDTRPAKEPK